MPRTVEAIIDAEGSVHLLEQIPVGSARRALVTILNEPPHIQEETTLLSEDALAEDWLRPEEDAAWSHLQSAK